MLSYSGDIRSESTAYSATYAFIKMFCLDP